MKTITISKIRPKRKSYGTFGVKKHGHKTQKRSISSFDWVKMLHSSIRDIDLVIKNHPNMDGLNILKQDMLDLINFKNKKN
ncbi:hypothetical protein [Pedobacter sp. Hv1]|uniref:hypothetical protein n=1 Tax=Pedobacter sp. Hv1 TaxID=1740090 RepID=UPI0006D8C537|nr:hypothetical protein [Pedobacter sp. Hv1]KQC00685.1 hypothetical protein AQF98_08370 [Pedobacter sp. Hv1]